MPLFEVDIYKTAQIRQNSVYMRNKKTICCLIAVSTITALAEFQSPLDIAEHLEQKLARFDGLWEPNPNTPCAYGVGVIPLPDSAPANGSGFPSSYSLPLQRKENMI